MTQDEDFYKNILDNLHDAVYFVERRRKITYWNRAAERLTGFAADEVVGSRCSDNILNHVDGKGTPLCDAECPLSKVIAGGQPCEAQVYLRHKDGHRLAVAIRVTPIRSAQGRVVGAAEVFSDNSSVVCALQRITDLEKEALLDLSTGLPNKRYIQITLDARLDELRRYGWPFGVISIDVDRFKQVNDTYGHETGDRVLKMTAKALLSGTRSFDVTGRWGGDEFIAVMANVGEEVLYSLAERLRMLVEQSALPSARGSIQVTASVGAALARKGDKAETVLRRADRLMYRSKAAGRNRVSMKLAA